MSEEIQPPHPPHTWPPPHPTGNQWEPMTDGNGFRFGRRLKLDWASGWIVQTTENQLVGGIGSVTFVPDTPSWIISLAQAVANIIGTGGGGVDLTEVISRLQVINDGVIAMSGTVNTVADALADLKADVAAETAVVDQAIVFINGVPAMIQAAIDAASANQALTADQQAAFAELKQSMSDEGSKLAAALPQTPPTP